MNPVIERIASQPFKSLKLLFKSPFRFLEVSVWPLTFLFLFIFMVMAFEPSPELLQMVIMAMAGWQAVHQAQMNIGITYIEEYWSQSLAHLFISPLRLSEMIIGGIITGVVKLLIVIALYAIAIFVVYGITITNWGVFSTALFFLFLFGIAIGMLNLSAMFLYGENAISLVWTISDIFVVLSGVYYSITVLPQPLQIIAGILPSTYAFDLLKSLTGAVSVNWVNLITLTVLWLAGSFLVLSYAFAQAKKSGKLVRVA